MKRTKATLALLALLIGMLLCAAAQADDTAIRGNAAQTVDFYVYAQADTMLTFTQTKGTLVSTGGIKSTVYGGYDIEWYPTAQPASRQTVTFTGKTASVRLYRGNYYTFRVTPYTMTKLKSRDAYLGLPGTYQSWTTPAAWTLAASNCRLSTSPLVAATPTPTPAPSAVTASVNVFYRRTDGSLITYSTEKLSPGTHVITSKLNNAYFTLTSSPYQTVTVSSYGVASPSSVTFYYEFNSGWSVTATPTPSPTATPAPKTATVYIYYRLSSGSLISTATETLAPGTHVITSKLNTTYFSLVSSPYQTVTVSANGVANPASVTFYFQYNNNWAATATPRPTATPTPTPTAAPQTVTVYVFYRLTDGTLLTYNTEKLAPGTHVISSRLNGSYFVPVGDTWQTVTVYNNGTASPSIVTFWYQYNSGVTAAPTFTPTPIPTAVPTPTPAPRMATVQVLYKQTDGTLLYQETRQLSEGTHMIAYDNRFAGIDWLTFNGPASYNVTVYSNGTISTGSITFYFSPTVTATPWQPVWVMPAPTAIPTLPPTAAPTPTLIPVPDESVTDQLATIGTAKIFPRPQPGKGKNTFNYEAIGQQVTVHSKARSLQNDGTWWVCISANLKCWGQQYVIDHQWINVTYLNTRSFDFDRVPLDPNYN